MRTVHETEALRPSDPVPKSMQPFLKSGNRLKLVIKQQQDYGEQARSPGYIREIQSGDVFNTSSTSPDNDQTNPFSSDAVLTADESSRDPKDLWRLLRRQVHWADEDTEALQRECEMAEAIRKKEWTEKEILLDQVIKNELDWYERRQVVLATLPPSVAELKAQTLAQIDAVTAPNAEKAEDQKEDQREAAAVLASMAQG
jgi:hypothetical protein